MKWTIESSAARNFLTVIVEGNFNADDHLRMIEDIISQPYWKSGMNVLFDSRNVNYNDSDFYIMQEASINMAKYDIQIGSGKAAILMGAIDSVGKGQQFEMLTEEKVSAEIGIFQDEQKAIDWLNQK